MFWAKVPMYVGFGLEYLCDIRSESMYVERPMSLALYIVITLVYINKNAPSVVDQVRREHRGLGLHKRERKLRA